MERQKQWSSVVRPLAQCHVRHGWGCRITLVIYCHEQILPPAMELEPATFWSQGQLPTVAIRPQLPTSIGTSYSLHPKQSNNYSVRCMKTAWETKPPFVFTWNALRWPFNLQDAFIYTPLKHLTYRQPDSWLMMFAVLKKKTNKQKKNSWFLK